MDFFHHLITVSALASTFGGIVRPICLAVFKLMTNSNFFGWSIGTSFRALSITRIEIKESVIYGGSQQGFVKSESQIHPEIELIDGIVASCRIKSMEKAIN